MKVANPMQIPADWAEHAPHETNAQLAARYATSPSQINRFRTRTGIRNVATIIVARPVPADFVERNAVMTTPELLAFYSCGSTTLVRWRKEAGVRPFRRPQPRRASTKAPAPDGLLEYAAAHGQVAAGAKFGFSRKTIRRMLDDAGVSTRREPIAGAPKTTKSRKPGSSLGRMGRVKKPVEVIHRDMSRLGRAVDYLQRFSAISRCRADGSLTPTGTHWRRGSSILTDDEVIERADSMRDREARRARSAASTHAYL